MVGRGNFTPYMAKGEYPIAASVRKLSDKAGKRWSISSTPASLISARKRPAGENPACPPGVMDDY